MPFRERLRKTFSRSDSGSDASSSLSRTITSDSDRRPRRDSSVYQPGEKMPPMKYRRPVAKEHKAHLEAFDFATAWRRRSHQSLYSPHGSRMPSRAPSVVAMADADAMALTGMLHTMELERLQTVDVEMEMESADGEVDNGSDTSVGDASDGASSSISLATSSEASELLSQRLQSWTMS